MGVFTFESKLLENKGLWLVTLDDKSKWVLDFDKMLYDNYEWYEATGTLESDLVDYKVFMQGYWKKIR